MVYNIDLFELLLDRSSIISNYNRIANIDYVTFYVSLRIIIYCDEMHDFSNPNTEINYDKYITYKVIKERQKQLLNDILWFLNLVVKHIYLTKEDLDYILEQLPQKYNYSITSKENSTYTFNTFVKFNRSYLYYIILNYYLKYIKTNQFNIENFLSDISNKILDFSSNISNCKKYVETLTYYIFGIIQLPFNYSHTFKSDDLLSIYNRKNYNYCNSNNSNNSKELKCNKLSLFVDQIGSSKNYSAINKIISNILEDIREKRRSKYYLSIVNTLASYYDSSTETAIDKMIRVIMEKQELENTDKNIIIDNYCDYVNGFGKNTIHIYFGSLEIISFQFINEALFIYQYFSHFINDMRIGGKIKNNNSNSNGNNASKNAIKQSIVDDINNIKLICFKTMGDFLQIINTLLYEKFPYKEYGTMFITGDIIAGNIAGIFLKNSILEKQTDNNETLIIDDSLFMFYNLDEIQQCKKILQNNCFISKKEIILNPFYRKLCKIYNETKCKTYIINESKKRKISNIYNQNLL